MKITSLLIIFLFLGGCENLSQINTTSRGKILGTYIEHRWGGEDRCHFTVQLENGNIFSAYMDASACPALENMKEKPIQLGVTYWHNYKTGKNEGGPIAVAINVL